MAPPGSWWSIKLPEKWIVKSGLFSWFPFLLSYARPNMNLIDIYPMASRNGGEVSCGTDVILPQAFGIMVWRAVSSPDQTWAAIIGKVMDLTYWASFVFTTRGSSDIESRCLNLHNAVPAGFITTRSQLPMKQSRKSSSVSSQQQWLCISKSQIICRWYFLRLLVH